MNASAPGKVILLGEHFVVHGAPAIALPLSHVRVQVTAEPVAGAWDVAEEGRAHLRRMCEALGLAPDAWTLRIAGELPVGVGLGSSAALAVALVRATRPHADAVEVHRLAHNLEKLAHGNPSGVDDTVAAWETPVWYIRDQAPEPLQTGLDLPLWIGTTPRVAPTHEAVRRVASYANASPETFQPMLERSRAITTEARGYLREGGRGHGPRLGQLMTEHHGLLVSLGVSTPVLDAMVAGAQEAGAWGAKLTGGGLGGAMIALAPKGMNLAPALYRAGAEVVFEPKQI